jgi:cyanophycin synthetase
MFDLTRHPRILRLLSLGDRLKRYFGGRPGTEKAAKNLAAFYNKVWRDAARHVGATVRELGHEVLEIRQGDLCTRVGGISTALDSLITHSLVRTKAVMYRILMEHGLPVTRHLEFHREDMRAAVAFLETCPGPCVIKPAWGTGGGLGVITGIYTRWQLARAAWAAGAHSGEVLIEEQVSGDNYRLLYLDGKLLDAVVRHSPSVIADGTSTVARLVERANAARLNQGFELAHVLLRVDMDMKHALARQGLKLTSVPPKGMVVTVKTATNENSGGDNVSAGHLLCDEVIAAGAHAVEAMGARLAGVDILTRNPAVSLSKAGGVILEVNSPPGFYWHYQKRDGAFPVAVHVLETLFADLADKRSEARRSSVAFYAPACVN